MTIVSLRNAVLAFATLSLAACSPDGENINAQVSSSTHNAAASAKPSEAVVGSTTKRLRMRISTAQPAKGATARQRLRDGAQFNRKYLRQATAATGKRYFIDFRSRYALSYGHTFVVFGRVNSAGKEIKKEVAGLAPASDNPAVYSLAHAIPVKSSVGFTDGDLEDEYLTAMWRVMLTKEEYQQIVGNIRRLQQSSPLWHAALYNCNAFIGDIAKMMGFRATFHWFMPIQYIRNITRSNGGRDTISWSAASAASAPGI